MVKLVLIIGMKRGLRGSCGSRQFVRVESELEGASYPAREIHHCHSEKNAG